MARPPFQVLVVPFWLGSDGEILYAVFRRNSPTAEGDYWQGIAGGGESNESPLDAARREAFEEGRIDTDNHYIQLDCYAMVPVVDVRGFEWGEDVLVIPEYCFGVHVKNKQLRLSNEHTEYRWLGYEEAHAIFHWDSNRTALWELNHRLTMKRLAHMHI